MQANELVEVLDSTVVVVLLSVGIASVVECFCENLVGKDDFPAKSEQVFENLKAAVQAAGGQLGDSIKLNVFVVDITQLSVYREIRDRFIDSQNPPVSNAVRSRLWFAPNFLSRSKP